MILGGVYSFLFLQPQADYNYIGGMSVICGAIGYWVFPRSKNESDVYFYVLLSILFVTATTIYVTPFVGLDLQKGCTLDLSCIGSRLLFYCRFLVPTLLYIAAVSVAIMKHRISVDTGLLLLYPRGFPSQLSWSSFFSLL